MALPRRREPDPDDWEQCLSRGTIDAILKLCMEDFKIDPAVVGAVNVGVRVVGGFAWSENTNRKA